MHMIYSWNAIYLLLILIKNKLSECFYFLFCPLKKIPTYCNQDQVSYMIVLLGLKASIFTGLFRIGLGLMHSLTGDTTKQVKMGATEVKVQNL